MRRPAPPAALTTALVTALVCLGACSSDQGRAGQGASEGPRPATSSGGTATTPSTPTTSSAPPTSRAAPPTSTGTARSTSTAPVTVARGLDVPWGLAFLPDGSALVTLRDTGRVLRVREGASAVSLGSVPGVDPGGEGGLLGVAVSPQFATDAAVFVYLTASDDNRVLRMTLRGNTLRPAKVIVDGIPKAGNHNGGRLAFGPDGFLYIGTGDAAQGEASQDRASLGGKILRVTRDGAAAPGNPTSGSRIWSLGHRNVQGLAWDAQGRMYASEFGQNTWDELNRIEPGRNYGWPEVEGRSGRSGFVDPIAQWRTRDASPSGIGVGLDNAVYMTALRGESLWQVPIGVDGRAGTPRRLLDGTYGRLRAVERAADGRLWILTSNTFRGDPRDGDDKVVILPASVG